MTRPAGSASDSPLRRGAIASGLLTVEAASLGLAFWLVTSRPDLPGYVHDNFLEEGKRLSILVDVGIAVALAVAGSLAVVVRGRAPGLLVLERISRRGSLVAVAWLPPLILDRACWSPDDALRLPLVLAFGWGVAVTLRIAWSTEPAFPALQSLGFRWAAGVRARLAGAKGVVGHAVTPIAMVILAAVAYAAYFSAFSIVDHRNLRTHSFDLGLEENLLWHVVHAPFSLFRSTPFSGPSGSHFGNHATFFAYLLAPMYALAPHAETLLVIQATLMGAAAVPLYLYAKRHVSPWTAVLVACAYLLYPPLHGANLYEFHYLPLGVFFLWLTLYAVEANRRGLAGVAILLALSVREDVAACLVVLGLFLLVTGSAKPGAIVAAVGAGYFAVMKGVLMPTLGHGDTAFLNQYAGLVANDEAGFSGVIKTLISNPVFSLGVVLEADKILYVVAMLTPVLLLPLTRPIGWLLLSPGILFTLLATDYWPLTQPSFQYTTYWTAFVFIGVVCALEHAGAARHPGEEGGAVRRRALAVGFAAAAFASTFLDGAVLHGDRVRAGFGRVSFRTTKADLENRAELAALASEIPPNDKVVASDRLLPHLADRDSAYSLEQEVYDADWLLFQKSLRVEELGVVTASLRDGTFGVVDERDTMTLARRGAPIEENDRALAHLLP